MVSMDSVRGKTRFHALSLTKVNITEEQVKLNNVLYLTAYMKTMEVGEE